MPPGWRVDRLKDVARLNATSLAADTNPDFEFDYLEISNVNYHGIIDPEAIEHLRFADAPSRARRRVGEACTIISSVRPNLQAAAFLQGRDSLICSTGFNVVESMRHKLLPKFAYYALVSEAGRQHFEATAKGVGYPAVDDKDFGSFTVPLPPVPEQERIVRYLDTSCAAIDAAVAAKRRQLDSLSATTESIIEATILRGLRPGISLRVVQTDWITEAPSHWEVIRLKRILEKVDYGISESTDREGRFGVLKMGDVQQRELRLSGLEYVEEVPNDLILETGDLLYNRTNSADQVGKAAVFRGTKRDGVTVRIIPCSPASQLSS